MPLRHMALVLLICFAWGGNFLSSALALQQLPPFLFTALRLALLIPLLAPWLRRPMPGQWLRLIGVGLCTGVLHFGLQHHGVKAEHQHATETDADTDSGTPADSF